MLIKSSVHEVKKRENSLRIINSILKKYGREDFYDLTGLAGGFNLKKEDMDFLKPMPALHSLKKCSRMLVKGIWEEKK